MALYGIYHDYDVDGGFGDAICERDLVAIFDNEELAKMYVAKWSDEYCYDHPYASLYCGRLVYEELPELQHDLSTPPEEIGYMAYYRRDHSNECTE